MGRRALPIVLLLAACGPAGMRGGPQAPRVTASHVQGPPGVILTEACTPTGPELCFNATDDNCNGVIDEGCGEPTGLLQFSAAWSAAAADVNLGVTAPDGETIPGEHSKTAASAFHLDHDCPREEGCNGQNEENVFFDGAEPPRGHYVVTLTLVDLKGADSPLRVRFGARLGARVVGFDVDLAPGDDAKKTFSFDVP